MVLIDSFKFEGVLFVKHAQIIKFFSVTGGIAYFLLFINEF